MKKIYLQSALFFLLISVSLCTRAQLSGTFNIPGAYATLAAAITDLNAQGVGAGGVTLNLLAGNPQTTPAGGYVIGNTGNILVGATNPTAANPVIIEGNGNTITAFNPQTVGNLNDGIFKLIGADYITIQNFIMQENALNVINTPAASNNMTEFGVAFLRVSVTDGAQNNTIQGNSLSLNRTYTNTFGIYSNARHSATAVTTTADITNVTGSNFGNKVYNNAINNVNYGVVFNGSSVAAQMDNGNDIGGSSLATGNTFTNWGTGAALSAYVNLTGSNYCIFVNHQINENVSYNTITSAIHAATNTLGGILKNYSVTVPTGTITTTFNNNTVTVSKSAASGAMIGINSQGISTALSTATITINNNTILNCAYTGGGSSSITGITNLSLPGTINMNNNVVRGNTSNATIGGFTGISNNPGHAVNTINITNNQIGNASGGAITFSAATTGSITGISNVGGVATTTVNLNNNSIEGISAVSSGQLAGVISTGPAGVAVNINNNNLGSATANFINYSAATANNFFGYYNGGGVAATTVSSISNNNIRGIVYAVTASSPHQYINSFFAGATQNINNNTFTNLSVNTTGNIFFIAKSGNMTATGVENCSNNSIVTAFNKTAAGGSVFFYNSLALGVNGSTMTQTGNNFSNVTVTGATALSGWFNADGASSISAPTKTITGNTFSNITGGTSFINVMEIDFSGINSSVSSNIISNITGNGQVVGILYGASNNQGTHAVSSNTISNLSSTGTGGLVIGISAGATTIPTLNVNTNSISGISTTGASSAVIGLQIVDGTIVNANSNIINTITGTGTTDPFAAGITVAAGTTVNVGYNKIHTINQNGLITTATGPVVTGLLFTGGSNVTTHNNFVANLNAVNTAYTDAIRGISVNSTTVNSTYNLYYNSVHINSASALATSGTSGIYHSTASPATRAALNMIDNIIVNTSASAGAGVTAAYRRSDASLTNYASTSDYNLFYAGTPSATNVIFYDGTTSYQTLAAYQAVAGLAPRDANSISAFPNFTSATDLHLTPANCSIDNKGTPIVGFTDDIDADTRSSTIPDIGADEFDAYNAGVLAGVVSTAVCSSKPVVNTGTLYTDASCNIIARVLPSGGDPVAGVINTCVTLDAAQLYFNGDPYVQRHYDVEPVTSNQTTTSATITMYFTDAEFVLYNTNNSATWPSLPTIGNGGNASPFLSNVRVTQFHGTPTGGLPTSTPGNYTGTRVALLPVSVVLTGSIWAVTVNVAGFSGFYVHTNLWFVPLPIVVNYLTGRRQGSNHLLNWKVTCTSTPRATMTLERSSDARNYTGINTITADAARCQQPFDYTDANPLKGMNYYRLKIVDADGRVTYSTTVALLNAVKGFDIISIAPNPVVTDNFKLNVASAVAGKMEISIFDMQGRLVNRQTLSLIAGFNSIPVNVSNLSSGTYTIRGSVADDQLKVIRFVKQ
jgi:Secretion system C-terminal sorting domain